MSKRMKKIDEDVLENRIIVSLIVVAVVIIIAIAYTWISNAVKSKTDIDDTEIAKNQSLTKDNELKNENSGSESASSSIGKTVDESKTDNNSDNTSNENAASSNSTSTQNSTKTSNSNNNSNSNDRSSSENDSTATNNDDANNQISNDNKEDEVQPSFIMPVSGDVIKGFSKENLVFSNTLQEWITHQALDIKANSRDVVKCAADGTVKAIKNDPRYGLTVIVEHSAGFQTVYSNLLTSEYVVEGENVKQGQTLGTVGSSAVFEIADESHLHFEMLLNSEYVDPSIYIK